MQTRSDLKKKVDLLCRIIHIAFPSLWGVKRLNCYGLPYHFTKIIEMILKIIENGLFFLVSMRGALGNFDLQRGEGPWLPGPQSSI